MIITNIGRLVGIDQPARRRGHEMDTLPGIDNAWLRVENGIVADYGAMDTLGETGGEEVFDAQGGYVLPSFCDSHTHIVYAGTRDGEFLDKIHGLSYEEIARRGGGILNSADRLHLTSEQELYEQSMERVNEIIGFGTGSVEIKSGYGLTLPDELKMLRVIARIAEASPLRVVSTFLGAHAVGRAFGQDIDGYVEHICHDMIPAVAAEGLASFVDVFCDRGFFTPEHTARILECGARYGMRPKIHANELAVSGGVEVGVRFNALSVDHLERAEQPQLELLGRSDTVATMLPGASFFLGMPYGDARAAIAAGATVALASDYNPGSSPSGNMRFVASLGAIRMKLTPEQAINAVTVNGAAAMGLDAGTLNRGRRADFIITAPMPSLTYLLYAYQTPLIRKVCLNGQFR